MAGFFIPYNQKLTSFARTLRNNSTASEIKLWLHLKGKQRHGHDFHRQKPLDEFIVDFFCPRLMLAIEIDGSSHDNTYDTYDVWRQRKLEALGVCFLRFEARDVHQNVDGVVEVIDEWIIRHTPLSPLSRGDIREQEKGTDRF